MDYVWVETKKQIGESDKARHFLMSDDTTMWIPKSRKVTGVLKRLNGVVVKVEVARWFAEKEGLVEPDDPKDLL